MPRSKLYSAKLSFLRGVAFLVVVLLGSFSIFLMFLVEQGIESQFSKPKQETLSIRINRSLEFGAVDPDRKLLELSNVQFDHLFIPWGVKNFENTSKRLEALLPERSLMVTIEPWKDSLAENLLERTLKGEYDFTIARICGKLKTLGKRTIIRFAHEMDVKRSVYPWTNMQPDDYKQLYRKFYSVCKPAFMSARFMWSPNGEVQAPNYYPGEEVVDLVGLSAYGYPQFEEKTYGKVLSFEDMLERKYRNIQQFKHDVYIAEFGVTGPLDYQVSYLAQAYESLYQSDKFQKVVGLVYFYFENATPWIEGIERPIYRVPLKELQKF